jgi:hypothetical protein
MSVFVKKALVKRSSVGERMRVPYPCVVILLTLHRDTLQNMHARYSSLLIVMRVV